MEHVRNATARLEGVSTSWPVARLTDAGSHISPRQSEAWHGSPTGLPPRASVVLTPREQEVLHLLCLRLTDREIAQVLCIGTRTAESHVARILAKLCAANRREAAMTAMRLGLV